MMVVIRPRVGCVSILVDELRRERSYARKDPERVQLANERREHRVNTGFPQWAALTSCTYPDSKTSKEHPIAMRLAPVIAVV